MPHKCEEEITFLSITMLTTETTIYLDPPLNNVSEVQILDFSGTNASNDNPLYLMSDIIESKSSYYNRIPSGGNVEIRPSQLLATIPSKKYPILRITQIKNPLYNFKLWILDKNGIKIISNTVRIRINLKIIS